jgi:uncharacterized repeat protein (TIGR03806 family)
MGAVHEPILCSETEPARPSRRQTFLGRVFVALLIWAVLLSACQIDVPRPVAPPGASTPVDRLSQLGIFQQPLAALVPAPGVVPYDVRVSLYADLAAKQRFMILPPGQKLSPSADPASDRWEVPVGTYFVKTFYYPNDARDPGKGIHLIETRFLVRQADGYLASTYVWNDEQTDAVASGGNVLVPVRWIDARGAAHDDEFHVPGTSYCHDCHDQRALGIRTRQLDLQGSYPGGETSQISSLVAQGLLAAEPPTGLTLADLTSDASPEERSRSYLDANCAHCHAQRGSASGTHLYFDYEHTGDGALACRKVNSFAGHDRVIVPGHPEQSEFLARMQAADPFARMPLGGVRTPDRAAIQVLSQWVAQMTPAGCP